MTTDRPCPNCGKPMIEDRDKWPGLWFCPDTKVLLTDSPPYLRKCKGMEITDEGCEVFDKACWDLIASRN